MFSSFYFLSISLGAGLILLVASIYKLLKYRRDTRDAAIRRQDDLLEQAREQERIKMALAKAKEANEEFDRQNRAKIEMNLKINEERIKTHESINQINPRNRNCFDNTSMFTAAQGYSDSGNNHCSQAHSSSSDCSSDTSCSSCD